MSHNGPHPRVTCIGSLGPSRCFGAGWLQPEYYVMLCYNNESYSSYTHSQWIPMLRSVKQHTFDTCLSPDRLVSTEPTTQSAGRGDAQSMLLGSAPVHRGSTGASRFPSYCMRTQCAAAHCGVLRKPSHLACQGLFVLDGTGVSRGSRPRALWARSSSPSRS